VRTIVHGWLAVAVAGTVLGCVARRSLLEPTLWAAECAVTCVVAVAYARRPLRAAVATVGVACIAVVNHVYLRWRLVGASEEQAVLGTLFGGGGIRAPLDLAVTSALLAGVGLLALDAARGASAQRSAAVWCAFLATLWLLTWVVMRAHSSPDESFLWVYRRFSWQRHLQDGLLAAPVAVAFARRHRARTQEARAPESPPS
jgi:hypothetical protein